MSEILDLLKKESSRRVSSVQEKLAEIYFPPHKDKEFTEPKKASQQTQSKTKSQINWRQAALILLGLIATLLLAVFLISTDKVNINITIIKEEKLPEIIYVSPNTIEFAGSAKSESEITDQYLRLVNSRGSGWANMKINFDEPLNLTKHKLFFMAKGQRGGEKFLIALKDSTNKTYQSINIMPQGLSNVWQKVTINLKETASAIDLNKVSEITLEIGSLTANNSVAATIYIKDLALTKK